MGSSDVVVVNPEAGEVRVRIANLRANDVFGGHASVVFVYPDVDDCGEVFYNVVDLELVRSVCCGVATLRSSAIAPAMTQPRALCRWWLSHFLRRLPSSRTCG